MEKIITVLYKGQEMRLKPSGKPLQQLLLGMGINPETVLVRRVKDIIPDTEIPKAGDVLEILMVASGG